MRPFWVLLFAMAVLLLMFCVGVATADEPTPAERSVLTNPEPIPAAKPEKEPCPLPQQTAQARVVVGYWGCCGRPVWGWRAVVVQPAPVVVQPAPVVVRPVVPMVPVGVARKHYPTPVRDFLFGRYRTIYAPAAVVVPGGP